MRTTLLPNRRRLRAALVVLVLSSAVAVLVPPAQAVAKPRRPDIAITGTTVSPGEVAETLNLPAEVVGGSPGDVLTVTAAATTTSRELSTANNNGEASVNFIEAGTIRGKVWLDEDRDGQREPGETALSSVAYGFWFLRIETPDGIQSIQAVVDSDGNYAVALKPNQYLVQVGVYPAQWGYTTPDVGDDATDSDVTPYFVGEVNALARSDVVEVTGGSESVIDVGLTYAAVG